MTTPPTSPPHPIETSDFGDDDPVEVVLARLQATSQPLSQPVETEDFGFDDPLTPVNGVDQREEEAIPVDVTSPSENPQLPGAQEFGINGASSSDVQTPERRS